MKSKWFTLSSLSILVVLAALLATEARAAAGDMLHVSFVPEAVSDYSIKFVDSGKSFGNPLYPYNADIALGDLDLDGDLDAFVANNEGGMVWLDNAGTFVTTSQILGGSYATHVALGDLDNDGDLDAFVGYRDFWNGKPDRVWLNNGKGIFQITDQSLGMQTSEEIVMGDVDNDGDLDAFVAACGNPDIGVDSLPKLWLNNGLANFSDSGQTFSGDVCSSSAAMGDIDGDGHLDLVIGRAGGQTGIEIWRNDGTGVFSQTQMLDRGVNFGLALGDLDGDKDLDLFVADGDVAANTVWLNNGSGVFTDSGQRLGNGLNMSVALGDLDRDGDLDAFVGKGHLGEGRPDEVWWNDGIGRFHNNIDQNLGNDFSASVALGDMDQDGDLDVFVATNNIVRVWANIKIVSQIFLPFVRR